MRLPPGVPVSMVGDGRHEAAVGCDTGGGFVLGAGGTGVVTGGGLVGGANVGGGFVLGAGGTGVVTGGGLVGGAIVGD